MFCPTRPAGIVAAIRAVPRCAFPPVCGTSALRDDDEDDEDDDEIDAAIDDDGGADEMATTPSMVIMSPHHTIVFMSHVTTS